MVQKIISFQDALEMTNGQKRHLLLGNGFSISLFPKIFSYSSLYENTDFSNLDESGKVFEILKTTDFEEVLHALETSARVIPAFTNEFTIAKKIQSHVSKIKNLLIQAIAQNHPKNPNEITEAQFDSCRRFLSNFIAKELPKTLLGNVYTVSYDLLLYWTIMHNNQTENNASKLILAADDGFRTSDEDPSAEYVTWNGLNGHQNIRFIHGGLHLFDDGLDLRKFCWERSGGIPLVAQIKSALGNDQYPLFVSEGSSSKKLKKIRHSHISLQSALKSFSKITGNLFIYGHSFADNDNHILNLIPKSKITNVFIGIYGNPDEDGNKLLIKKAMKLPTKRTNKNELVINFYNSKSAHVWDNL